MRPPTPVPAREPRSTLCSQRACGRGASRRRCRRRRRTGRGSPVAAAAARAGCARLPAAARRLRLLRRRSRRGLRRCWVPARPALCGAGAAAAAPAARRRWGGRCLERRGTRLERTGLRSAPCCWASLRALLGLLGAASDCSGGCRLRRAARPRRPSRAARRPGPSRPRRPDLESVPATGLGSRCRPCRSRPRAAARRRDRVADRLQPARDGALGDALAERGHRHRGAARTGLPTALLLAPLCAALLAGAAAAALLAALLRSGGSCPASNGSDCAGAARLDTLRGERLGRPAAAPPSSAARSAGAWDACSACCGCLGLLLRGPAVAALAIAAGALGRAVADDPRARRPRPPSRPRRRRCAAARRPPATGSRYPPCRSRPSSNGSSTATCSPSALSLRVTVPSETLSAERRHVDGVGHVLSESLSSS
jgi:hypothetical protein